jgi:hypothetical protein
VGVRARPAGRWRAAGIAAGLGLAVVVGGLATGGPATDAALTDLLQRAAGRADGERPAGYALAAAVFPTWIPADSWPPPVRDVLPPAAPVPPVPPVAPKVASEPRHAPNYVVIAPNDTHIELAPMRDCPHPYGMSGGLPLSLTPASGSVTLSWRDTGDPGVKYFRVGTELISISVTDPGTLNWQRVDRVSHCGQATVTLAGLQSGRRYRFYLEVVGDGVMHRTVARSEIVTVP